MELYPAFKTSPLANLSKAQYNKRKIGLRCYSLSDVPKTHLRYLSLTLRDTIVEGVAHGRGEAMEVPTRNGL